MADDAYRSDLFQREIQLDLFGPHLDDKVPIRPISPIRPKQPPKPKRKAKPTKPREIPFADACRLEWCQAWFDRQFGGT